MPHSHELDRDRDHDVQRSNNAADTAPGRGTRTQDMTGPTGRMPSGILMRKAARDGNGVQAGAENAVASAGSSSGHALPSDLRGKFESSLGADLSSVRLHTGAASADAASAVGAKAYTLGNDIHFGAGHYNPSSADGQHLLAHEVAHTVQQSGGLGRKTQFKLEVSSASDSFEVEADRAADAMVSGTRVSLGSTGVHIAREPDTEITFEDDYATPSSQMRNDGDAAAAAQRRLPPSRSVGASTSADVNHAGTIISWIEEARGPLGMLQGREAAATADGQSEQAAGVRFVPYTQGSSAIAHNTAMHAKLSAFRKSASRQSFQHTFFAQAYQQLGEDFVRLRATVEVIKQQSLQVTGNAAKHDITEAKTMNPLLADAINGLKGAVADLESFANHATSGIGAIASSAGGTFDELGTATEAMKLPPPKLEDSEELASANAMVAKINADLDAAKAGIATIKSVVTTTLSLATGGVSGGGPGMKIAGEAFTQLGKKAEGLATKYVDPHTDGLRHTQGAKTIGAAGEKSAISGIEGALADWMTNYSGRISAANGKVKALNAQVKEKYAAIQLDGVRNLQAQLGDLIGKFALLLTQIELKKAAVTDAAKKVQEAQATGPKGSSASAKTDIGAVAQAMASVTNFVVQADAAENLGRQEQAQGEAAQTELGKAAGGYLQNHQPGQLGGSAGLAETAPMNGEEAKVYTCTRAGDADARGTHDFSGYNVEERRVVFTVNEDDVDQRSVVMRDRTAEQLERVANLKAEAETFKGALSQALGIGPSTIK